MADKNAFTRKFVRYLGGGSFFWLVAAALVLQAGWIALSGNYPLAFDEDYHFGLIKVYAHHISPFWSTQPTSSDVFGAMFRDPSYLYHWLMSFPYRLISGLSDNLMPQIMFLRVINIGLFVLALWLLRKLLLKTGASKALVNTCLAILVLLPVTPLLASQISYDNLFLPITACALLLTLKVDESLKRGRIDLTSLLILISVCLAGSLVKFAFLPIFAVILLFLLIRAWQYKAFRELKFNHLSRTALVALTLLVLIFGGLFVERYGVNIVRYHIPVPACDQVLSEPRCEAYAPWRRDHFNESHKAADATKSPVIYSADWYYGMWLRTFFAVDGPASNYSTRGPLILPGIGAIVFASFALVAFVIKFRELVRGPRASVITLFLAVSLVYVAALWAQEYQSFVSSGRTVAINGRYLLPIYPLIIVIGGLSVSKLGLKQSSNAVIAAAVFVCLIWGGGALTYVLRSSDSWYWPNSPLKTSNHAVQRVIGPIIPGYRNEIEFMGGN